MNISGRVGRVEGEAQRIFPTSMSLAVFPFSKIKTFLSLKERMNKDIKSQKAKAKFTERYELRSTSD